MTHLDAGAYLLRPFVPDDAPAFAAAVRESVSSVGRWMDWAHAGFSEQDALDWFAACAAGRADGSSHEFAIVSKVEHRLVGGAGLNKFIQLHAFCNLGYWVRTSAQRQGAASAAVAALARHAFQSLGQARVEIVVADGNAASLAVARRSGAQHECLARRRLQLRGRAVDAHMFALIPEDFPDLPTHIAALRCVPGHTPSPA